MGFYLSTVSDWSWSFDADWFANLAVESPHLEIVKSWTMDYGLWIMDLSFSPEISKPAIFVTARIA